MNTKNETTSCPDCGETLIERNIIDTDRYGILAYFWCKVCEENYVSRNGNEVEIAAPPRR